MSISVTMISHIIYKYYIKGGEKNTVGRGDILKDFYRHADMYKNKNLYRKLPAYGRNSRNRSGGLLGASKVREALRFLDQKGIISRTPTTIIIKDIEAVKERALKQECECTNGMY